MARATGVDVRLAHVDLFSGIGGFPLALREVSLPVALCELDEEACGVLRRRFPGVPVWEDIRTLQGRDLPYCDLLTAGFPCQDLSVAGRKRGLTHGRRSCLIWELIRLLRESDTLPTFILLENVPTIVRDPEYGDMLDALRSLRYDLAWGQFDAWSCGAVHIRARWFLLAKRQSPCAGSGNELAPLQLQGCPILSSRLWEWLERRDAVFSSDDDPTGQRRRRSRRLLRLLGNAVVPAQVRAALTGLMRALGQGNDGWRWLSRPFESSQGGPYPPAGLLLGDRYRRWIQSRRASQLGGGLRRPQRLTYDFTRARQGAARLPLLQGIQYRRAIATPRRLQATASAPTRRTLGDFGTSVAFCVELNRHVTPQGSTVDGEFMCMVMGYPADWADMECER